MGHDDLLLAMTNKSIRTVKSELAFLADNGVLSGSQLADMLRQLPSETVQPASSAQQPTPVPPAAAAAPTPVHTLATNLSPNEKQYETAPPALCHAVALYAYTPTDAGDLALVPGDGVAVTEYMNAEWWKGTNLRTRVEGIFPRLYVRVDDKAAPGYGAPAAAQQNGYGHGYGNAMAEVAGGGQQQGGPVDGGKAGKGAEMGKRFGKKLGNAAVFGAGATIGSNLVNGIL